MMYRGGGRVHERATRVLITHVSGAVRGWVTFGSNLCKGGFSRVRMGRANTQFPKGVEAKPTQKR